MVNSCYSLHVHKILASTSQRYDWGQKIEWSILTRTVTTHIRGGLLSLGLDFLRLAYLPNLKFLYQRITKIRKAIQNVENGVAWDSQETRSHSRSLEIAPLNRAHTTFGLPYAFILHHFWDIASYWSKNADCSAPTCICRHCWGYLIGISPRSSAMKPISLGGMWRGVAWRCLRDPTFSCFAVVVCRPSFRPSVHHMSQFDQNSN